MRNLWARGGVVLALLASSLTVGSPASAGSIADEPPTGEVRIELVAMAGSGCPPGSADVAIAQDKLSFTAIYSEFLAEAGPNIVPSKGRKNCQLNVLVQVPNGYTFAIAKVDYRGYAQLQRGSKATRKVNYYFSGMSQGTDTLHPFTTPFDNDWIVTDEVPIGAVVYRPCGELRNLNINNVLQVEKGTSTEYSYATTDSTDGSVDTLYHLAWKRCR